MGTNRKSGAAVTWLLLLLVTNSNAQMGGESDSSALGTNFFVAAPSSRSTLFLNLPHTIYLGTAYLNATYAIEDSSGTQVDTGTAVYSQPSEYNIDGTSGFSASLVTTSGFSDRNKGLHISATGSESLFVLYTLGDANFFGSYLAYPCVDFEEDEYEYYAISVQGVEAQRSQVLLVGCEDDTKVAITPTASIEIPSNAQTDSPMVTVASGSTSDNITLHQTQTLLFSNSLDLTGTRIVSNKPLTVISGHECANVPVELNFCEQLAVQIPPTLTWGTEFLLAPFAIRSSGQFYRIVAAEDSTAISVLESGADTGTSVGIAKAGGAYTLPTASESYYYVLSNKPIFVTQLAKGGFVDTGGDGIGDPVMLIVPPTHMYVNSTTFITLDSQFTHHAISVTVVAGDDFNENDVLFDGSPLECTWKQIESINGSIAGWGCTFTSLTSDSQHFVTHNNGGTLSVLSYGFDEDSNGIGYGYLAGMLLQRPIETNLPTVPTDIFDRDAIPFLDLQGLPGLSELPREQDAFSEPIFIPRGMIIDDRVVTSVYVNENGAFSFDDPWKFSHPNRYPTDFIHTQTGDVISPFWADGDIRKEGTVRYVPIARGEGPEGDELLDMMVEFLQMRDGIPNSYVAKWMLIAQWDKIHPHPHGADDHMGLSEEFLELTNTFQGIIITDNSNSYYMFSYTCGDIQWSTLGRESAVVGYNAHTNDFFNHPSSGFSSVGDAVSCTFSVGSKRQAGMTNTITQDVPEDQEVQMNSALCDAFQLFDLSVETITTEILPNVEECPTTLSQAQNDDRFREDDVTRNPGVPDEELNNRMCYLQTVPFRFTSASGTFDFVQQCCYDTTNGAIYTSLPQAGTLISQDPFSQPDLYQNDVDFKQVCCAANRCDDFLERRPINTGDNYEPPSTGHGLGDPHYKTFDNQYYDFQGNGDYIYVELLDTDGNVIYHVQGRIGFIPAWNSNRVTGHRSVAFGSPNNPKKGFQFVYQDRVELYETPIGNAPVNLFGTLTREYTRLNGDPDYMIKLISTSSIMVVHISGIVVEATWRGTYMDVNIGAPGSLLGSGRLRGIYGNFDGNAGNDFFNRATPQIPVTGGTNSAAVQAALQSWAVTPGESLFRDQAVGRRKRQIDNPIFFEDLNPTPEQIEFCNNDSQCLLDLIVTNDSEVAMTTMEFNVEVITTLNILNNFPPTITGSEVFDVTVGQESVYSFVVDAAEDEFNVTVINGLPEGATLESNGGGGAYTFRWMLQSANDAVPVTFLTVDAGGAAAMLSPRVQVCACVNGMCTLGGILNLNTPLIILNCVCEDAYDGDFCEEDIDGCTQIECFEGVTCIDQPAPSVGAMCGDCPVGFTGDGEKCTDLDECASAEGMQCESICVNTVGSFNCDCMSGFELTSDGFSCSDIDECAGPNECHQGCSNTDGSFVCTCLPGFVLSGDGINCEPTDDCIADPGCSGICARVDGTDTCFCQAGFALGADGLTCADVDECTLFPDACQQTCNNTEGFFQCACQDGYNLNDDLTTCSDVNECEQAAVLGEDLCATQPNTQCVNTEGSFSCDCVPGYSTVQGQCLQGCSGNGGCSHICAIVNSTKTCFCPDGVMLAPDGLTCNVGLTETINPVSTATSTPLPSESAEAFPIAAVVSTIVVVSVVAIIILIAVLVGVLIYWYTHKRESKRISTSSGELQEKLEMK